MEGQRAGTPAELETQLFLFSIHAIPNDQTAYRLFVWKT
jgi:hypothetical protein